MNKTRTAFLLMAQYERPTVPLGQVADDFLGLSKRVANERPTVPLGQVADDFLGLSKRVANERANAGELPFPVFRLGSSQKNPYMVHVDDLADFTEKQRADAHRQWERSQV